MREKQNRQVASRQVRLLFSCIEWLGYRLIVYLHNLSGQSEKSVAWVLLGWESIVTYDGIGYF